MMRLLEWEAENPAVTGRAYKRATGRTVELGLAQVKAGRRLEQVSDFR